MDCNPPESSVLHYLQSLLKFMSIELVMLSNHLILCQLLLLLPSVFPSIRVFSNKLAFCTRWPKYLSFTFSISPSNEYSGLISLGLRGLISLLPKQGTLKSLLQDYSSEASILWCSAFFMVWLTSTHDYWKNYSFDYAVELFITTVFKSIYLGQNWKPWYLFCIVVFSFIIKVVVLFLY